MSISEGSVSISVNEWNPVMKSVKKLKERYQKILGGTASTMEQELIARWLKQLDIGEAMDKKALAEWQERSMTELQERAKPPVLVRSRTRKFIWLAGAAAVLLLGMVWLVKPYRDYSARSAQQVPAYIEHSTAAGQRKMLTLADGSRVWLGNASKIRYPENFQPDKRRIFLEGQAFFEVKPDSTRPFFVYTSGLDVKVLGTSFDVKHYPADAEPAVTVASGIVSVKPVHEGRGWMLEKGEQLTYRLLDKTATVEEVDLRVALSWKDGELIFRETPLEAIAVRLERWYGVEIQIASPSLQTKQMSLSVKNEPLQTVFGMLSEAGDFNFDIQKRKVTVWK
ncbi:anti-sigma factor [Parapedobacter pyrenivorans]|uniref:Anti-sigma factor n=1 Tax=Parapedobacter pyrenivorans TaxID=1305674 RepID=A0A917HKA1_9SPHI|nr:FecR domain-containing protein [Parapedobacter pyrenivorans]GGG82149.1 anti-sigma factor [Parapedobacter pyrenivorans]